MNKIHQCAGINFILMLACLLLSNCKQPIDEPDDHVDQLALLDSGCIVFQAVRFYPPDQANIVYGIDPTKIDTSIFEVEWIWPVKQHGFDPDTIEIRADFIFKFKVLDKLLNTTKEISKTVLLDTIRNSDRYDYRNEYTGTYFFWVYSSHWDVYDNAVDHRDTISGEGWIEKFKGYTTKNGSNYSKMEFKIGIVYAEYSLEYNDSKCGGVDYYTEGFLHPSVDLAGTLTYFELEKCDGRFVGFLQNDSIYLDYDWGDKWGGFSKRIVGVKK